METRLHIYIYIYIYICNVSMKTRYFNTKFVSYGIKIQTKNNRKNTAHVVGLDLTGRARSLAQTSDLAGQQRSHA
jgi:hypothetical protein